MKDWYFCKGHNRAHQGAHACPQVFDSSVQCDSIGPFSSAERACNVRYMELCHAMQTGVAMEQSQQSPNLAATSPKHLRVGVNTALRDLSSLVELLVSKGILTSVEVKEALVQGMHAEVKDYEARVSAMLGKDVTLH